MRITNELRTKIDRAFSAKKNQKIRELDDRAQTIRAEVAEDFAESLRMLAEDENYSSELSACVVRLAYDYREPNIEDAARKLANKFENEELEEIGRAINQTKNDSDREKEEFLIAVSYADGDISSIKAVFAEYGITF